jgi:asparagine synthase (glutamine-hydrolysing)
MCGINLLLTCFGDESSSPIVGMMEGTSHRGPDQARWMKVSATCYVGANRLKISGLDELADQPLVSEEERHVLVWNGALYNHWTLRNRLLDRGVSLRSSSDSEVLLHWFAIFGLKGIGDLEGMFSLFFIDLQRKRVVIARDLTGQKPLYYHKSGGQWLFSSEVKGILGSGLVPGILDTSQFVPYHYLRHPLPTHTFFQDVYQFPAGKVLELDFAGKETASMWLTLRPSKDTSGGASIFTELLTDAVMSHFHTEVPVGIILSGGADSTLLYELWYRETGMPLRSYTAVFEERYREMAEDGKFAKQVAKSYQGAHHEVLVTPDVFLVHWEAYCMGLDQPIGDSAGFLTWLIAKEATREVKVLISGAGADELMGGYNRHWAFLAYLKHRNLLLNFKNVSKIPGLPAGYRKFFEAIEPDSARTFMNLAALQTLPDSIATLLAVGLEKDSFGLNEALAYERKQYLTEDILKVFDNSCMAFGIEGRSPYLDYPILRFFEGMPERKQRELIGKKWIKESLVSFGRQDVAGRRKLGFGIPIVEWFHVHDGFKEKLLATLMQFDREFSAYLSPEMRTLVKFPQSAIKRNTLQVWNLFLLASWMNTHRL